MNSLNEYIKYYGSFSFDKVPFNDVDNIIFSTLAYLPFKNNFSSESLLKDLIDDVRCEENLRPMAKNSIMLARKIVLCDRYKYLKISNFVSIFNDEVQFSAMCIKFLDDFSYVAFRGTDGSLIGWQENFALSYVYPNKTQVLACDYLNKYALSFKGKIYVGGHSKGGNLAMFSCLECSDDVFNSIVKIYNNDGPGFLPDVFNSSAYKRLATKLVNIIPTDSVVGILLFNKNFHVVLSSCKNGMKQHDMTTWLCFGQFLLEGKLSKFSKDIQNKLRQYIKDSNVYERKKLFEEFFSILKANSIVRFSDLRKMKIKDIQEMISDIRDVDSESKKLFFETMKYLLGFNSDV